MIVSIIIVGVSFTSYEDSQTTKPNEELSTSAVSSNSYLVSAKYSQQNQGLTEQLAALGLSSSIQHHFPLINTVEMSLNDIQLTALMKAGIFTISINKSIEVAKLCKQFGKKIKQYDATISDRVNASNLHQQQLRGDDITIAVVDTGLTSFSNLRKSTNGQERLFGVYDVFTETFIDESTDGNGHGTHVSSVALNSKKDNQGRFYGIAPDANFISVKAFDEHGLATYADVIRGIEWLITHKDEFNIRVLNLSFSATATTAYWQDPLNRIVMKAWEAGIVVVASAGNSGPDHLTIGVPGNTPYVITVGAMTDGFTPNDTSDDYIPSFSAQGPTLDGFVKPEVIAPGGHVLGLMSKYSELAQSYPEFHTGLRYFEMSGTSQSAAVVSGVVALILQNDPQLTPDQVKCKLLSSASAALTDNEDMAYSVFRQGAGLVDAQAAINSTAMNCANTDMNITADLANEQHYFGPADMTQEGQYYVHGLEDLEWTSAESVENSGGFLWRTSFLVDGGFLWRTNLASSGGFLWRTSFVASSGGFLWRTSDSSVANATMSTNSWVDQH